MHPTDIEIQRDGELLTDVLRLLETQAPLHAWGGEALAALAAALCPQVDNAFERGKAVRLARHLFAGPPPEELSRTASTPSRRADRLRADLADLLPFGAGLHLFAG